MNDRTSKDVAREWREKELTFVVSALAIALDLDGDEQRDALCDLREWAKNRLKAQLPDETSDVIYTKTDVEALLAIALAARAQVTHDACKHPREWRTKSTCGICLKEVGEI